MARLALLAITAAMAVHGARAADAPPASAFGAIPALEHAALSPDGTMLALDQNTAGGQKLLLLRVGESTPARVLSIGEATKVRSLNWSDADTVLVGVSATTRFIGTMATRDRFELFRTMAADVQGGAARTLLFPRRIGFVTGAYLLPVSPSRKDMVSMVTWDYSRDASDYVISLFDVDTTTGKGTVVAHGTSATVGWLAKPDGTPLARLDDVMDDAHGSVQLKVGDGWRSLLNFDGKDDHVELAGLSPDGQSMIVIGDFGTDRAKAWSLPLEGGPPQVAFESPDRDVEGAQLDPATSRVVGYWLSGYQGRPVYVDPEYASLAKGLAKAFPDRWVTIGDRSADGKRMLIRTESPSSPPVFYLLDRQTHRADIVGEAYPGLEGAQLGTVRELAYASRDGKQIPAFLTLPPGREPKSLPLVVLVHGGPAASDSGGFDWWAQFLATRGYAVLQPQFRGSTGYGKEHRLAGRKQWGGLMQDDVTDGVHYLVKEGIADPKRICIVGASYGGYAALAGATLTPELYACAVSVNGVTDLPQKIGDAEDDGRLGALAWMRENVGSPFDPKLTAVSPARNADNVRAPILLIHSTDDTVVNPKHTTAMAKALKSARKPYEVVTLPGEDHWLSFGTTRVTMLEAIETFLAKHL